MNSVIYARYPSDSQREESIEGQIRECKSVRNAAALPLSAHILTALLSAKTDNRPESQRMIKDSAKRLFEVVLVWKLDRFSRNRYGSAMNKATLRKNGAKVISAKENGGHYP